MAGLPNFRMERKGHYDFGATVHGSDGVTSFEVDFSTVYDRLVAAMARFFEGGIPPVQLQHIVENVAVMQAGNLSISQHGKWVSLASLV